MTSISSITDFYDEITTWNIAHWLYAEIANAKDQEEFIQQYTQISHWLFQYLSTKQDISDLFTAETEIKEFLQQKFDTFHQNILPLTENWQKNNRWNLFSRIKNRSQTSNQYNSFLKIVKDLTEEIANTLQFFWVDYNHDTSNNESWFFKQDNELAMEIIKNFDSEFDLSYQILIDETFQKIIKKSEHTDLNRAEYRQLGVFLLYLTNKTNFNTKLLPLHNLEHFITSPIDTDFIWLIKDLFILYSNHVSGVLWTNTQLLFKNYDEFLYIKSKEYIQKLIHSTDKHITTQTINMFITVLLPLVKYEFSKEHKNWISDINVFQSFLLNKIQWYTKAYLYDNSWSGLHSSVLKYFYTPISTDLHTYNDILKSMIQAYNQQGSTWIFYHTLPSLREITTKSIVYDTIKKTIDTMHIKKTK